MNARLRRLYADYMEVREQFAGHPFVDVVPLRGNPPEAYEVRYHLRGLELDPATRRPRIRTEHVAQIYLTEGYPREKPKCTLQTPIFHPNFGAYICLGDYFAAGEGLASIIIQIGEMIQYQSYNPKSPLDPVAARWAEQNRNLFPIGTADLYQPEVDVDLVEEAAPAKPAEEDLGVELC